MWDGQSISGGDFFGGLLKKWRAANPSDETVSALRNLFHEDRDGLNLSQWLLEKFELRLYGGSLERMIPKLRNYDNDKIAAGYAQGYEILNRVLKDTHLLRTETSAAEMNRFVEARSLSLVLCAVAGGYLPQASPGYFLVIYNDGGNQVLVEFPAGFDFCRFLGLHVEFMLRALIAVLSREEIARRIHEFKVKSLFAELAYSAKPDRAYDHLLRVVLLALNRQNNDSKIWAHDFITEGIETLKNQPTEVDEIKTLLSVAFSGLRAQNRKGGDDELLETRARKRSVPAIENVDLTRLLKTDKLIWELSGRPDEKQKDGQTKPLTVEFVRSNFEELSNWQKKGLAEAYGKKDAKVLEAIITEKYETYKDLAAAIGKHSNTIRNVIKRVEQKGGMDRLLEILYPTRKWERLLAEAGKEA